MEQHFLLITKASELKPFVANAINSPWLGIDTEFVRDRHYFARFGLLQIAIPQTIGLIDPIALAKSPDLLTLLFSTTTPKILHAGYQDLELFARTYNQVPAPLFDTQVAASQLGLGEQLGYSALVRLVLEKETVASMGRYDWTYRPLPEKALAYAADDVRYLGDLYRLLSDELRKRALSEQFTDTMQTRVEIDRYLPNPEQAWSRIRARGLQTDEKFRLQRMAAWREYQAIAEDRPRQWVLRDSVLLTLAHKAPDSENKLRTIRGLSPWARRRYGNILIELIQGASPHELSEEAVTVADKARANGPSRQ